MVRFAEGEGLVSLALSACSEPQWSPTSKRQRKTQNDDGVVVINLTARSGTGSKHGVPRTQAQAPPAGLGRPPGLGGACCSVVQVWTATSAPRRPALSQGDMFFFSLVSATLWHWIDARGPTNAGAGTASGSGTSPWTGRSLLQRRPGADGDFSPGAANPKSPSDNSLVISSVT